MHDLSVRPLSDIASLRGGYAFKSKDYTPQGAYSILTIANVGSGVMIKSRANKIEVTDETPSWAVLNVGDIVVTLTGNVGRVCKIDEDGWLLNQRVGRLIPKECDPEYLYQVVSDERFIREMELSASIGAQPNISNKSVLGYEFPCHPLREQKSVAAILSTWDSAIEATERLLENSKQRKKALMQQLLTGKKRLPGFEGGWVSGRLGDLCTFKGGQGFPEKYQGQAHGDIPFIKVSDMNLVENTKFIVAANNWLNSEVREKIKAKPFPAGSVVFAKVGAALKLNRRRILTIPTCIDNNMMAALAKQISDSSYLFNVLSAIDLARVCQDGALPSVNQSDMASIKLPYPPTLEEQEAISAVLETADGEIASITERLALLTREKKALMQQLLTGKKRVTVDKAAA